MAEFTVFTKDNCPYCLAAKHDLTRLGHTVVEKPIEVEANLLEMQATARDAMTVPQIFIGAYRIGGYVQLKKHITENTLEAILEMVG